MPPARRQRRRINHSRPDDRPVLALLDGALAFRDLQRGQYPRYVTDIRIGDRL